jgi:hypothetical protein
MASYRAMIGGGLARADAPIEDAGCNDAGGPIDPGAEPEHCSKTGDPYGTRTRVFAVRV